MRDRVKLVCKENEHQMIGKNHVNWQKKGGGVGLIVKNALKNEWNKCNVVLLHKGGHKSMKELKNYRSIALADTVSKIFCGILNERIKYVVEEQGVMGEKQNNFRRDRCGEDNLFVLSEIIERKRKEKKKMYLAFLDIEKAYDRVDRRRLLDVLGKIGFSENIVNIVKSLYENKCAVYRLGNLLTGW
ncbi:Reverse transcriptase domain [Trinorchestia longiramus]|nr:Reverse transcriptase domain [Trinorchestia longiramus]